MAEAMTAAVTHPGLVREDNEDAWKVLGPEQGPWDNVLIVADGMGGHASGKQASALAVESVVEYLTRQVQPEVRDGNLDWSEALAGACDYANTQVRQRLPGGAGTNAPGSTLTVALLSGSQLFVAQVGDSRAYLVSGASARQVTEDQTWVAEQVRAGQLTEDEALRSPFRGQLSQAIGTVATVNAVVTRTAVNPGDLVLLCTDGLHDYLSTEEVGRVVGAAATPETALRELAEVALQGGGEDNLTAVVGRVAGKRAAAAETDPGMPMPRAAATVVVPIAHHHRRRRMGKGVVAACLLAAGLIVVILAGRALLGRPKTAAPVTTPPATTTTAPGNAVISQPAPEATPPLPLAAGPPAQAGAITLLVAVDKGAVALTAPAGVELSAGRGRATISPTKLEVTFDLSKSVQEALTSGKSSLILLPEGRDDAQQGQIYGSPAFQWTLEPKKHYEVRVMAMGSNKLTTLFWVEAKYKGAASGAEPTNLDEGR